MFKNIRGATQEHTPYRPEVIDLVEFPPIHDFEYRVNASRSEGEEVIRSLAIEDEDEHLWTFDGVDVWRHHDAPYHKVVGDREGYHGINIPQNLFDEIHDGVSMYHTHPSKFVDRFHSDEPDRELYAAIPSSEDFKSFFKCVELGIDESRIISKYGITSLRMSRSARERYVDTGTVRLEDFNLSRARIKLTMNLAGRKNGIKQIVSELNTGVGENVGVSYSSFDEGQSLLGRIALMFQNVDI